MKLRTIACGTAVLALAAGTAGWFLGGHLHPRVGESVQTIAVCGTVLHSAMDIVPERTLTPPDSAVHAPAPPPRSVLPPHPPDQDRQAAAAGQPVVLSHNCAHGYTVRVVAPGGAYATKLVYAPDHSVVAFDLITPSLDPGPVIYAYDHDRFVGYIKFRTESLGPPSTAGTAIRPKGTDYGASHE